MFHCQACQSLHFICLSCDRGNIYCPICAPIQKEKRLRDARRNYRQSLKGKLTRAAAHKRARLRALQNSEGDRGSTLAYQNVTASSGVSEQDYKIGDSDFEEKAESKENPAATGPSMQDPKKIRCSFCNGECAAFVRSGESPWARDKRRWLNRKPRSVGFRRGFT
jgi:uncharacterized Zn finger protein (UPF0148 family)